MFTVGQTPAKRKTTRSIVNPHWHWFVQCVLRYGKCFSTRATIHVAGQQLSRSMRMMLALVIMKVVAPSAGSVSTSRLLWTSSRSTALLVWMMLLITRGSTIRCCTCGSRASASDSSGGALASTRLVSGFTPSQAHFSSRQGGTRGVRCVGIIGKSGLFLTLATSSWRVSRTSQCSRSACCNALGRRSSMSLCRRPWRYHSVSARPNRSWTYQDHISFEDIMEVVDLFPQ